MLKIAVEARLFELCLRMRRFDRVKRLLRFSERGVVKRIKRKWRAFFINKRHHGKPVTIHVRDEPACSVCLFMITTAGVIGEKQLDLATITLRAVERLHDARIKLIARNCKRIHFARHNGAERKETESPRCGCRYRVHRSIVALSE